MYFYSNETLSAIFSIQYIKRYLSPFTFRKFIYKCNLFGLTKFEISYIVWKQIAGSYVNKLPIKI